jgi:Flp pilus assembly protein TadD
MKRFVSVVLFMLLPTAAWAEASYSDPSISESFRNGSTLVEYEMYDEALRYLHKADTEEPNNADILNMIAYSYRKLGRFDVAYRYYQKALAIDPDHKGANEYLGELYVETKRPLQAQAQLAKLKQICSNCKEYKRLKRAIAAYDGPG